jgi:hypothetical protein
MNSFIAQVKGWLLLEIKEKSPEVRIVLARSSGEGEKFNVSRRVFHRYSFLLMLTLETCIILWIIRRMPIYFVGAGITDQEAPS